MFIFTLFAYLLFSSTIQLKVQFKFYFCSIFMPRVFLLVTYPQIRMRKFRVSFKLFYFPFCLFHPTRIIKRRALELKMRRAKAEILLKLSKKLDAEEVQVAQLESQAYKVCSLQSLLNQTTYITDAFVVLSQQMMTFL